MQAQSKTKLLEVGSKITKQNLKVEEFNTCYPVGFPAGTLSAMITAQTSSKHEYGSK